MRTWKIELAIASAILLTVAVASGGGWLQLVGACAVILSFAHMQVADRLAESEGLRAAMCPSQSDALEDLKQDLRRGEVHCHAWARRYLVGKELLWLVYFVALGAWAALAGVALFLLYPVWRGWYRG